MKKILAYIVIFLAAISCRDKIEPVPTPEPEPEPPVDQPKPETPTWPEGKGKSYVWDDDVVPEITIRISESEWNNLLLAYDQNSNTTKFVKTGIVFNKADVCDTLNDVGIRLRDNIRCKRPEGKAGESHKRDESSWNQCNYELSFALYKESQTLREVKDIFLKSCVNDPTYARERYCYDLFSRYGLEHLVSRNIYCRLNIHVEGDEKPACMGLYQMIEPVDSDYLNDRSRVFSGDKGFLWKCRTGANLQTNNASMGTMDINGSDPTYALVTNKKALSSAIDQLGDFISNLNKLNNNDFIEWIESVTDVEELLRTYAVLTVVGASDDYWNKGNNYYLYFNSPAKDRYQVFFIPHNFEVSLGTNDGSIMEDSATQSPLVWGKEKNPLISRMLQYEVYQEMYKEFLAELITPEYDLFSSESGTLRILDLMYQASPYTANDTGFNTKTADRPASWSTRQYRLTAPDSEYNFFKVRTEAIMAVLNQ